MPDRRKPPTPIAPITHGESRVNIPTPELAAMMEAAAPLRAAYAHRNPDLDPQLIWRGKDMDQVAITADAPPLYCQEQIHPQALIEDLRRSSRVNPGPGPGPDGTTSPTDPGPNLFDHFKLEDQATEARIEFYRHRHAWSNRMILGDALQVMASLAEREGLKGQVQAIYIDPPYGIRFNSNFQWSTTSRDVKDGKAAHLTREPEQVKAFRDTWRDGIHSYLNYLRDRLVVARALLADSGSCFVQIGDENVHRVRALMDEVFGEENFVSQIIFVKTSSASSELVSGVYDVIVWYAKNKEAVKFRDYLLSKEAGAEGATHYTSAQLSDGTRIPASRVPSQTQHKLFTTSDLTSQRPAQGNDLKTFVYNGAKFTPGAGTFKSDLRGLSRLAKSNRLAISGQKIRYVRFLNDYLASSLSNVWTDTGGGAGAEKRYVVETSTKVIQRCLLMVTDPGDLVLDPTCGSGTTAYVAEQWGRRWIAIDTSRVALALARSRLMGARFPWYLLADSKEGQVKLGALAGTAPADLPVYEDIRHGFVYRRVPHITLKSIANNTEIDTLWDEHQPAVDRALATLNTALAADPPAPLPVSAGGRKWQRVDFAAAPDATTPLPCGATAPANALLEWEVPLDPPEDWPDPARAAMGEFHAARRARQQAMDASIAARADYEHLYDKPFEARGRIRVAGPFTVESLSPHRTQAVDEEGELITDAPDAPPARQAARTQEAGNYHTAILDNLNRAGVQQMDRGDRLEFTALSPWPGTHLAAEGRYLEGQAERRAGILIGPQYGTLQRADLTAAAREAAEAGFDILITCAFNYDAHTADLRKLGRLPILQARMNPDLQMAGELKAGGGNLFVVFGEPDIELRHEGDMLRVALLGVDIFRPETGEVRSEEAGDIACWFIDTEYDEESFFVRQAYFPGANIPWKHLQATLKAEVDADAWDQLKRTTSRPFPRPASGRVAVKVINHLGDEVMKVLKVDPPAG
ncbi:MAG: site-specific DNA-methyltransferase [Rhodobacteraceae bacterium]|nr:site-specific DNA-methyltransferase [Paracoccaceae bacterium]